MTVERFTDVTAIFEFRGAYPSVPTASGVDREALTAGDDDPFFVTMPIGMVDSTSGNKRFYNEAFIVELEKQVIAKRPIGLMGHLSEEARATEFPDEAVHWVGAVREANTLWGKGYVPPGAVRDRIKRYIASGRSLATSIDALASGRWDKAKGAQIMEATSLQLNQIDFAPADRAGIAALSVVPHTTRELDGNADSNEENGMDKLEMIRELTAEDAKSLPDTVREAILGTVETPVEVAQLAKIRETLGLSDKDSILDKVTELLKAEQVRARELVDAEVGRIVKEKIVLESARPIVIELINSLVPETVAKVQETFDAVVAKDSVVEMLKVKAEASGPAGTGKSTGKLAEMTFISIPKGEGE